MMLCFERDIDMLVVIEKKLICTNYLLYSNQHISNGQTKKQKKDSEHFIHFYAFISILQLGLIPHFI